MNSSPESAHEHAAAFHPFCPRCRYDLATLPDGPCPECGTPFTLAQLRLFWLQRFWPDSDEALLFDFKPSCPQCQYDLAGLPEGPCPECGGPFTIRDLQDLFIEAKLRRRPISPRVLLAVFTMLALVIWNNLLVETGASPPCWFMGFITAGLCAAMMCFARERLLVRSPFLLLAILVFTLPGCLVSWSCILWLGVLLPLPLAVGTLIVWCFVPNRHRLVPLILLSLLLLPPGIAGLVDGARGWHRGEYWSAFDSVMPSRARYNWSDGSRPLGNSAACLIGASLVATTGLG